MSDDVLSERAVYEGRRRRVLQALEGEAMDSGGADALVLAAAPQLVAGPDTELRDLPDADLYWLTGCTEPGAVLVLAPSADTPFTLFVEDRDPEQERWTGPRGGVDGALERYGADAAHALAEMPERLPKLVGGAARVFTRLHTQRSDVDHAVRRAFDSARRTRPRSGRGPHTVTDPVQLLGPMRRIKDEHEVGLMRAAADASVAGFRAACALLQGGKATGEWELEAALEHAFRMAGASGPAFPSIVAGGAHATVLHYIHNDAPLPPEGLVLVDAGARVRMYCGDLSRTYAVAGRMNPAQRAVWEVVHRAHAAGLAEAVPGRGVADVHDAALHVLVDGLLDLGLLQGSREEAMKEEAYRRFYPHRTSHWLGLDVHDVGDYADARLAPGMVFTVEPGLYILADDDAVPAEFRGIGVRIEDDVLITADGHEVLTAAAPMEAG